MGFGSFLKKAAGGIMGGTLGGLFGTGDSAARKAGQKAADQQAEMYQQYLNMVKPSIKMGTSALGALGSYSNPDNLDYLYNRIATSDLANSMIGDRQRAATQAFANAGLRRSGAAIQAAADLPTEVIGGLLETMINNQTNVASLGLGQGSTGLGALGGISNAMNNRYEIQQGGADRKSGILGGLLQMGGNMAAAFSDRRLKTNERVIGSVGPLNLYEWDWVEGAEALGAVMSSGFMADEVAEHYPQHVYPTEIAGVPLLTVDYKALLNDLEANHGV